MRTSLRFAFVVAAILGATGCAPPAASPPTSSAASPIDAERAVGALLDRFHDAASRADEATYFGCLLDESVFLGTDPGERWDKAAFLAYARPHFAQGKGWTYRPTRRHVHVLPDGQVAVFDELLTHAKYGTMRGSGVAVARAGVWYVLSYDLSKPIPNDRFEAAIRAADGPSDAAGGPTPLPSSAPPPSSAPSPTGPAAPR